MPFDSRTYRILIASPSDVEEEREIAVRVIQEWNDLYSYTRRVVLLPLRWETHTAPEYGTRPQEVINRAIVDQCDLLIGIFWTRIGTPTVSAPSGTIEEISRVAAAGKPVMLYFSNIGMDPDKIDLAQLGSLKDFKVRTSPNALVESYKSQIEFRDKFAKQLELKVRDLQKGDETGQPPPVRLLLLPADGDSDPSNKVVTLPEVNDLEEVLSHDSKEMRSRLESAVFAAVRQWSSVPIILAISNTAASGIRNLFGELSIVGSPELVDITDIAQYRTLISRPSVGQWYNLLQFREEIGYGIDPKWSLPEPEAPTVSKDTDCWRLSFEWDALQPQRTRVIRPYLVATGKADCHIVIHVKLFADSFPEPVHLKTNFDLAVRPRQMGVAELIPNLDSFRKQSVTNVFSTTF